MSLMRTVKVQPSKYFFFLYASLSSPLFHKHADVLCLWSEKLERMVRASRPKSVDLLTHSRDQTCGGNLKRGLLSTTNRRMRKKT